MARRWWIGSYSSDMGGSSRGIEVARERADGSLEAVGLAAEIDSASFLLREENHVYAAAEGAEQVVSFRIDDEKLVESARVPSGGGAPCQLTALPGAVVVANYLGGSLGIVSREDDGTVAELVAVVPGDGSGPRIQQKGPHLHASIVLPDGSLLAADLGADLLRRYRVEDTGLVPLDVTILPPGTGPRDLAIHSSGLLWMLGELGGVIHVFDASQGALREFSAIALPGWVEGDQAAALAFSADGRFAYAGVRGSDRISVIAVSEHGRPEPLTSVSCEGAWPRHLVVDGDVLHVANERSNSIASFRLGHDGVPVLIDTPTAVDSPTYLLAIPE